MRFQLCGRKFLLLYTSGQFAMLLNSFKKHDFIDSDIHQICWHLSWSCISLVKLPEAKGGPKRKFSSKRHTEKYYGDCDRSLLKWSVTVFVFLFCLRSWNDFLIVAEGKGGENRGGDGERGEGGKSHILYLSMPIRGLQRF